MSEYVAQVLVGVLIIVITWLITKIDKLVTQKDLVNSEDKTKNHTEKIIMKHTIKYHGGECNNEV